MDAVPHLMEVEDLRDEPLSGWTNDPKSYGYTLHHYTNSLDETYDMVNQWRNVVDEYEGTGDTRVMMIEAYANMSRTMDYYRHGAHFPFNFGLITSVNRDSGAQDFKRVVDDWFLNLPAGATSNWVVSMRNAPWGRFPLAPLSLLLLFVCRCGCVCVRIHSGCGHAEVYRIISRVGEKSWTERFGVPQLFGFCSATFRV